MGSPDWGSDRRQSCLKGDGQEDLFKDLTFELRPELLKRTRI